jgi:hypothetical protein
MEVYQPEDVVYEKEGDSLERQNSLERLNSLEEA